jgi:hypothetical protein
VNLEAEDDVQALLDEFQIAMSDIPVVIARSGKLLRNPTNAVIVAALGLITASLCTAAISGELAGSGTANPKDVSSFRNPTPTTFHGKALAIIRPNGAAGAVTLRASCLGLEGASVTIKVA